ncbi:antitoxin [Kribbella sp. NPDC048915]|uniref:antitoxin n=1 Tax=Kribbella sp. NPDC048915 TaxID=3155148 RepID=UPI0033C5306E
MNDFQEQAKNWLRNVVKQNPDKIKAGVEKAGDLIDKQTGGKYAEKVDSVQRKVGDYVDKSSDDATGSATADPTESSAPQSSSTAAGGTAGAAGTSEADTSGAPTTGSAAERSTADAADGPDAAPDSGRSGR